MNLFNLDKENIYQNTVRVLVYPNVTFQEDLEKDSFCQVAKKQIELLNQIRTDLWFYLILPCPVPSLNFDNVTQWYMDFETYPQTMRSHFRVDVIRKMLNNNLDFDLIMSHLPESTHQLVNTLYNVTHHTPLVFGWAHWFDLKDVVSWPKDSFLQNITGLLEYDKCYLNTQHQKDMVLKQAKETFNDKTIEKLDKILTVQHLGVDAEDVVTDINENPEKIIVFNHRPDTYKHFNHFISLMDKLWEQRKDFKVWVPLSDINKDYTIKIKEKNKQAYYNKLQKCCVGFSPKQKYGGWSVATTDGMMNGCPYIMYNDTYYHELNPNADFFKTDDEALLLLNSYLDTDIRNKQARKALDHIKSVLIYKDEVIKMSNYMNELLDKQKVMGDSHKLKEIVEFIKQGPTTKKQLMEFVGWGRGIKWTPYRRALMKHPNIFDIRGAEPIYKWSNKT